MNGHPTTVWILGDQLTPRHSALVDLTPETSVVLMIESQARAQWLPYHKPYAAFASYINKMSDY